MKKILLGGTALAAAALVAMPAFADEKPVTSGLNINITGFVAFEAGLVIGSSDDNRDREYDFNSNGRLQFDIKNVTDSGLEYGARIRMNNVNRRNNVEVDRQYVYLKSPEMGILTFGDSPQVAGDFGYFFAPDDILNAQGSYGDNLDGNYRYGGGGFFSLDPTYQSGLDKSTSIKYSSPSLGGFIFAVGFTPVIAEDVKSTPGGTDINGNPVSGKPGLSSGTQGRADLFNKGQVYENAISGGIGYEGEFDGTSVKIRGTASYANGIDGHFDLKTYSAGGQVGFGGIVASVVWVGTPSGFGTGQTDKDFNTVGLGLGYSLGNGVNLGLGYAYTWADKDNDLTQGSVAGNRFDLKDNHIAVATVNYTVAPGLNTYAEVVYEIQNYRKQGFTVNGQQVVQHDESSWEQATFLTGISVAF